MSVSGRTVPRAANPAGTGSEGRGRRFIELNVINARVAFDRTQLTDQKNSGTAGNSVYPKTSDSQLNVAKGDFLVKKKEMGENWSYTTEIDPPVFSSLNGIGAEAKAKYPDNPKRQKQHILSELDYAGISHEYVRLIDENRSDQSFMSKQHGNATHYTREHMPFGSYVKLDVIDPSDPDIMSRPQIPGEEPGTVKLEPRAYHPSTLSSTVLDKFREFLEDEDEEPEDAFDAELHEIDPYRNHFDAKAKSSIVEGILFLRRLTRHGFFLGIDGRAIPPELEIRENPGAALGQTELLLGLAKAFGYLGNVDVPGVQITRAKEMAYMDLRKAFMSDVFYDGSINQNAFHYEEGETFTWAPDLGDSDDPGHRFTQLQLDQFLDCFLAMVDALEEERRWVVGKVIQAADQEESFHMILRQ